MDESLRHDNPNPTLTANPLSLFFYTWLSPLFRKGYKGWLEESDMYNVCPHDSSKWTGEKLQAAWDKELEHQKQGGKASLARAMFRAYGIRYLLYGSVGFIEKLTQICQPVLVAEFVDYFTPNTTTSRTHAWLYATGIVLSTFIISFSHHPYFFLASRVGMRIRVGLCSMMYRKTLRLSNKSLNESSVGQIVNLMSNDVSRFDRAMIFNHFLWMGPAQLIIALVYLCVKFGPSILSALTVVVLLIPSQFLLGKLFSGLRRKTAAHTDKRVKVMNEIISGIRIIKLYCWEKPFGSLVNNLRREEVRQLRRTRRIQGTVFGLYYTTAKASIFLFILTFVLTGREEEMRPSTVFLLIGVIESLRLTCGMFVPMASQLGAETWVTINRIQAFLLLEEQTRATKSSGQDTVSDTDDGVKKPRCGVELAHVTAKWDGSPEGVKTLDDVTVSVSPGKLVAVIGPVGSGKTSLLMSILGELPIEKGSVRAKGKVAYVSQHAWIFSGSLRQNILFGEPLDKTRYEKIIKISALSRDLTILPKGDATLIGDRGVTLSGGQKARVSLARALYMNADLYLLDDPLAAVDTAVGRHIFEKCIVKYLKDKPRILVTHQVQLLPVADNIVILSDGKVLSQGTYAELSKSGVDFSELLKSSEEETLELGLPNLEAEVVSKQPSWESAPITGEDFVNPKGFTRSRSPSVCSEDSLAEGYVPDAVQLPEEEERETGSVGMGVFTSYFKAGAGIILFTTFLLFYLLAETLYVLSDWWLSRWTDRIEDRHSALEAKSQVPSSQNSTVTMSSTPSTIPEVDTYFNLYVYAGSIIALLLLSLTRTFLFLNIAVKAGETLHNRMFARVLRATISFFDTNPVGRVLNRFSKDTGQIDDLLPHTMLDLLQDGLQMISVAVVAAVVNPWVLIPTVPILVLFVLIRRYYVCTSRSVKRLEGTTRSPVFSYLSASVQGLHTIRAMHMEERLSAEFDAHQDLHTEAWFLFMTTSRWLGLRLDSLSSVFVACVVFLAMLAADSLNVGVVGLTVVYAMRLTGIFQWTVRQSVEIENQMISVERVLQYSRLPVEADLESRSDQKPPETWPTSGSLQAKGVRLQYSPSAPFVLEDINFDIHSGEKIGIVGRTGAGKSSLITTLFRLAEPEGELTIDDVSIHSLGLHDLRKAISIIPQDPVLFTGSVRRNLDPFDEYADSQLWRALDEVQLKDAITSHPDNLYMEVTEGGSNFSAGQRQLMCLARAVLGNTRILMIDEATANVDPITDELIQQTIRDTFKTCTVLTIAHRLHTVIDSDRIMVLDAGKIVEMDRPIALLSKGKGGVFYSMVEQLGQTEMEHLTELASMSALTDRDKPPPIVLSNGTTTSHLSPSVEETTDIQGVTLANHDNQQIELSEQDNNQENDNKAFESDVTRL